MNRPRFAGLLLLVCAGGARIVSTEAPTDELAGKEIPGAIRFSREEADDHRLGWHDPIRTSHLGPLQSFAAVIVESVVAPDGRVVSARPVYGPEEFHDQAVVIARTWKYRPFRKHSHLVFARIRDRVQVLPEEIQPTSGVPFPKIHDWSSLRITLKRGGCCLVCFPTYQVEIRGDGTVLYNGQIDVAVLGQHRDSISQRAIAELVTQFQAADYFSLPDRYAASISDCPTYITSMSFDGVSKAVLDYVGEQIGMPSAVTRLEDAIDRLAGTEKWTNGNAETIPSLIREGWNFRQKKRESGALLVGVAEYGDAEAVRDLISAAQQVKGLDPAAASEALRVAASLGKIGIVSELLDAGAGRCDHVTLGRALGLAAATGKIELVRLLLSFGADPNYREPPEDPVILEGLEFNSWPYPQLGRTVLMQAAQSGVPEVVQEILKAHPDVNARSEEGQTALMLGVSLQNDEVMEGLDRGRTVQLLLQAGAEVDARSRSGDTALIKAFDANAARLLVEAGADVNAQNNDGETALMWGVYPEMIRLLLRAGADPTLRNKMEETALDWALAPTVYRLDKGKAEILRAAMAQK